MLESLRPSINIFFTFIIIMETNCSVESCRDFIQWLGHDLSMRILSSLENPSDIIRFGAVSTHWRDFATVNGLSKKLCLQNFPELSKIPNIIKEKNKQEGSFKSREQKVKELEREHKVYAYLCRGLTKASTNMCISNAVTASSTDNYPQECLENTLEPRERVGVRDSYWSSTGQTDPTVPQKLVYNLISNICIVTEIHIQPFQAQCLENRTSIYSPRAVQFRMGYPKSPINLYNNGRYKCEASQVYDDAFSWTYISPEFPMAQENCLQKFKLPEPVLCIGGILQIELLGGVQIQVTDGLYYIRITHVQVIGKPLSPEFDVEVMDNSGRCKLGYYPELKYRITNRKSKIVSNKYFKFRRALGVLIDGEENLNSILVIAFIFLLFIIKEIWYPFSGSCSQVPPLTHFKC